MMLVFLQNAWSPLFAGKTWPRDSWLRALERSRSGRRLKIMIDDLNVCQNTTPIVGSYPGAKIAPCHTHMTKLLQGHPGHRPSVVVACGRQAGDTLTEIWRGHLLIVPHPAARLLKDATYRRARKMLKEGYRGRGELKQLRGRSEYVEV